MGDSPVLILFCLSADTSQESGVRSEETTDS
jgi:hypothetical protein